MHEIIKIIIQGESGNCPASEAYKDKLTIEPHQIQYEYSPLQPSDHNPSHSWLYKTTGKVFQNRFQRIAKALPTAFKVDHNIVYTNIGGIEFYITYDNGMTDRKFFYVPADEFKNLFGLIKHLIPGCERTPEVLMTNKDREKYSKRT